MADELTPNYKLFCPSPSDPMDQSLTDVPGNLDTAFTRIEQAANPTIIAASPLPQSGDYEIGDRVFLNDATYPSSYILLSQDINWGWIWRPVQAPISPWYDVPASAFTGEDGADYSSHPTNKVQIALDNKGRCYWRGVMQKSTVGIPDADSLIIFQPLPTGLRHHTSGMYTVAIDPATPQSDLGLAGYKGGRLYIGADGYSSFRFHNPSSAQYVHLTGIEYASSTAYYWLP